MSKLVPCFTSIVTLRGAGVSVCSMRFAHPRCARREIPATWPLMGVRGAEAPRSTAGAARSLLGEATTRGCDEGRHTLMPSRLPVRCFSEGKGGGRPVGRSYGCAIACLASLPWSGSAASCASTGRQVVLWPFRLHVGIEDLVDAIDRTGRGSGVAAGAQVLVENPSVFAALLLFRHDAAES